MLMAVAEELETINCIQGISCLFFIINNDYVKTLKYKSKDCVDLRDYYVLILTWRSSSGTICYWPRYIQQYTCCFSGVLNNLLHE